MDAYVARQPIFDRQMRLYGYELLYRKSQNNFYEGGDDDEATISLLNATFLVFGFNELVDGTKGFINFSQNLLKSDLTDVLPKKQTVIEILERVEATDEVVRACRELKAKGYMLALDDFVIDRNVRDYAQLIELLDIIKVEFPSVSGNGMRQMIDRYKGRIVFLAEKVESMAEYRRALDMGFELFQGYFFSKPVMSRTKEIGGFNVNLLRALDELNKEKASFASVARIIQMDVDLSYKLFKMANSAYYAPAQRIESIHQALVMLGTKEIRSWLYLMLLRGVRRPENEELVKISVIRGKMLSLMAQAMSDCNEYDYFIAGIFSSVDTLLNEPMEKVIQGLALSNEVRDALLGKGNRIRESLDLVLAVERAQWDLWRAKAQCQPFTLEHMMSFYIDSIRWQQALASQ